MRILLVFAILMIPSYLIYSVNAEDQKPLNPILEKFLNESKIIIVIGKNAAASDIYAANQIEEKLRQLSTNDVEIRIDETITDTDKKSSSMIIIGGSGINKIAKEINNDLILTFIEESRIRNADKKDIVPPTFYIINQNTGLQYGEPNSKNYGLGFVQLKSDYYSKGRSVVILAGIEAEGTIASTRYFLDDPAKYDKIYGGIVVVSSLSDEIKVTDPHLSFNLDKIILSTSGRDNILLVSNGGELSYDLTINPSDERISINEKKIHLEPRKIIPVSISFKGLKSDINSMNITFESSLGMKKSIPVELYDYQSSIIVTKQMDKQVYQPGSKYISTILLNNTSNEIIPYIISEKIDYWLDITDISDSCNIESSFLLCKGEINAKSSNQISYSGQIISSALAGNWRLDKTHVSYGDAPHVSESNDVILRIQSEPKLLAKIFVEPETITPDSTADVTIIVRNEGIDRFYAEFEITIPDDSVVNTTVLSSENVNQINNNLSWKIENIEPNQARELKLKIKTANSWISFGTPSKIKMNVNVYYQTYVGTNRIINNQNNTVETEFFIKPALFSVTGDQIFWTIIIGIAISFVSGLYFYKKGKQDAMKKHDHRNMSQH